MLILITASSISHSLIYCRTLIIRTPIIRKHSSWQFVLKLDGLTEEFWIVEECDQENVQDWLDCDVEDPGYQVQADEEIDVSVNDDKDHGDEDRSEK
ncbi:hypothetical protein NPIL_615141 [Nephila pilipes]|uniref:Uncharacterized protein n=1 Tax=Nephila pilipes TaxID=299642 RepID=A0A8X6QDE1_NEPPI|nr:hypothetical protein NPIL_615141 [Nephila pilipes]